MGTVKNMYVEDLKFIFRIMIIIVTMIFLNFIIIYLALFKTN